jgi:hypothetical protein
MAVAAPYIALLDLSVDSRQRVAVVDEEHHVPGLSALWSMVEVENTKVALPTVHARMGEQILAGYLASYSLCVRRALNDDAEVLLSILAVVATRPSTVAFATDVLEPVGR